MFSLGYRQFQEAGERGTLMASAGAETTVSHARHGTAHFGGPNNGEGFRARDV